MLKTPGLVPSTNNTSDFSLLTTLRYDEQLLNSPQNSLCAPNAQRGSPFYMLRYHRDRLLAAARHFMWEKAAAALEDAELFEKYLQREVLNQIGGVPVQYMRLEGPGAKRVRITLDHAGTITVTMAPILQSDSFLPFPPELRSFSNQNGAETAFSGYWRVYLATKPTAASSFTRFKTTERTVYNDVQTESRDVWERHPQKGLESKTPTEILLYDPMGNLTEGILTTVYLYRNGKWVTPPLSSGCQDGTTRRWALEQVLCIEDNVGMDSLQNNEIIWLSNGVRGFVRGIVVLHNDG